MYFANIFLLMFVDVPYKGHLKDFITAPYNGWKMHFFL